MDNNVFKCENNVIILSKQRVSTKDCQRYLRENVKHFRKDSKILILYGVHGEANGEVGDKDKSLQHSFGIIPKKLKKDFPDLFENITFEMVDVGNHKNVHGIDEDKLIEAIKNTDFNILFLAFCFTYISTLNDLLREAGIYTQLILSEDRASISSGRLIFWDKVQEEIVQSFVQDDFKNVFLMGESGTGKTLILSQALGIKVSKYRRLGKKVNVIIANYVGQPDYVWHDKKLKIEEKDNLIEDLEQKYLAHLTGNGHSDINVRFASLRALLNGT